MIKNNSKEKKNYDFDMHFFNVGKADSILIRNKDKYIMIDTATEEYHDEILSYLNKHNITKLDYLIITHFDKDHVGSASYIIDNIEILNILQNNSPKDSSVYNKYIDSLKNKNITPNIIDDNYSFDLEDMNILVEGTKTIYKNNISNNNSLITKIFYKNNSFLFMGDSENARIKEFVSKNNNTFDFIKVPYHGRYLKRINELLESISPKYGVITSSYEEDNNETIKVLNDYNVEVYLTREGSIDIYSDGNKIIIEQ